MLSNSQIQEVFINASLSQKVTHREWNLLQHLMQAPLNQEEKRMIRRIVHSVDRGWFSLVAS
ncbi:hypothetical protein JJD41_21080 [Oxynema sp. CENA135]|jgi:hypothetical protein|uniref:Uncharacterized protein n=1 Tax=Oxynema aestuarii AP17 TaxID=2064643 RepID=A0A6H1TUM7_9CYAN|nr:MULTISPECIES: hypothetical protein [Oxynema]MBK4732340.1 hypothetical protein [Oxynema sp. CENA135]QIZ69463.1 hypothetical protein HCG48_01730 [Oxynema aestuarii AP17]RMH74769.1 MAG: hypothetical protein D6680_13805 [Cyanobacteria bacterium J007]